MECKKIGVKNYDFSGIDPKNNPGVYNFKKGTGAINFASLGELEWCNSNILRYFINLIIRFRNRSIWIWNEILNFPYLIFSILIIIYLVHEMDLEY